MSTDIAGQLDLDVIRDRAVTATEAAQGFRDRAAAGDPAVDVAGLATVEGEERLARLQLAAAERRDAEQRELDAAAQLEADRAAMQREWAAAHASDADADVRTRMAAAVAAAITYIRATQDRANYLQALAARAQALGFRVDVAQPPNPLPPLGQAILAEATAVLPWAQTTAHHGVRASSVWTT